MSEDVKLEEVERLRIACKIFLLEADREMCLGRGTHSERFAQARTAFAKEFLRDPHP